MIVIDFFDIIGLVVLAICVLLFIAAFIIDRISCSVKKRQQKKIDKAYQEVSE